MRKSTKIVVKKARNLALIRNGYLSKFKRVITAVGDCICETFGAEKRE
jgi:hypothetical protein